MGEEHGDADLASLLGPIAADVGGMLDSPAAALTLPQQLALGAGSPARVLPFGTQPPPRPPSAPVPAVSQQHMLGALPMAHQPAQQLASTAGDQVRTQEGGLLAALAQWTTYS